MILLEKAESNVKVKQSNEEQKSLSSFWSPLPDPDNDKDTENEKNEKAPDPHHDIQHSNGTHTPDYPEE